MIGKRLLISDLGVAAEVIDTANEIHRNCIPHYIVVDDDGEIHVVYENINSRHKICLMELTGVPIDEP